MVGHPRFSPKVRPPAAGKGLLLDIKQISSLIFSPRTANSYLSTKKRRGGRKDKIPQLCRRFLLDRT